MHGTDLPSKESPYKEENNKWVKNKEGVRKKNYTKRIRSWLCSVQRIECNWIVLSNNERVQHQREFVQYILTQGISIGREKRYKYLLLLPSISSFFFFFISSVQLSHIYTTTSTTTSTTTTTNTITTTTAQQQKATRSHKKQQKQQKARRINWQTRNSKMSSSSNNQSSSNQSSSKTSADQPAVHGKYVKKDTRVDAMAKQQSLQRVKKTTPNDPRRVNKWERFDPRTLVLVQDLLGFIFRRPWTSLKIFENAATRGN